MVKVGRSKVWLGQVGQDRVGEGKKDVGFGGVGWRWRLGQVG
jgi:hypothetical protein